MFDAVELGRKLSKADYEAELPELRTRLLEAQALLDKAGSPVIVLINGADGAGKSETANVLHGWLDARYLVSEAYAPPTEEEREHPGLLALLALVAAYRLATWRFLASTSEGRGLSESAG
jgi:polyphosphate kinase 2 (PPK2 family)